MKKVWNEVWETDNYSERRVRLNKALKKFDISEKMGVTFCNKEYIADFGAGGGFMTEEFIKRYVPDNKCKYDLFDYSEEALKISKEVLKDREINNFIQFDLNLEIVFIS